ncbi:MAG TPA: PAS domain-containing protein, partial [Chitinophagaceae bacterium]|nr:PAS domain-containing protein [Chitinophagaceae bacterium]
AGLAMIEADNLQQVKGKSILGIIDDPYRNAFKELNQNVFKGKPGKMEFEITGLKGTHRWLETHAVPLKDTVGKITSLLAVTRDITESKRAEQDLLELTTRLQLATSSAKIGIFDWDIPKNKLIWDENMYRIFGVSPDKFSGAFEAWSDTVHPDDIQNGLAEVQAAIDGTKDFHTFFRILWKNKEVRYVEGQATILRDAEGKATRMIGVNRDITEQNKAEEAIRESNERYEFINKATQDMIWEWDYLTKTGRWGDGIINTFGYSKDKLEYDENWLTEYVHPEDKERILKNIQDRIENKLQNCQNEYRFRCADGSYKYVFDRGYIIFDKNKKPFRMFGAITDITEKKRLERELATQLINQQKLITETTIQAQEKEKNELGRELHDNINQILATVKMYLGLVKSGKKFNEDLVGKSYEYVEEAMNEIRELSHSLVAPSLGETGLKECLLELAEDTNINNGLQVQVSVDEKYFEKETDKNKELVLYRIVQEQLNNILKYAQAREAVITLSTDQDNLILTVSDNGVGFNPSEKSKGIGLKNISSRVAFYSGVTNIISAPGKGCTLEVLIPL